MNHVNFHSTKAKDRGQLNIMIMGLTLDNTIPDAVDRIMLIYLMSLSSIVILWLLVRLPYIEY